MKSIKYISLLLGMGAVAFTSCSDFLDTVPDERTEIDSPDKVVSLLVSAYPESNPAWIGELSSDNIIDNQAPHLPSSPNDKQILSHYNYSHYTLWDNQLFRFEPASTASYGNNDSPGQLWSAYYSSIATVNHALQAIDNIEKADSSTSELKAAKGEALLLRAYDHFMLVNIFSKAYKDAEASKKDVGVPYVTEPENVVSKQYDRGNVADVYAKIGKDLEEGLQNISDVNFKTAPKYHFNTNAAHAFAARYYLYTHQWQKVIDHANEVLGTDSASVQNMLMDLSSFKDCSSADDYATAWQHPNRKNNLLLIDTYSLLTRRVFGYRYSCAGPAARAALMINTSNPLWRGYICPAQMLVSGQLFSSSSHDYGFISTKIYEKFEYTDKISGIGYPHIIYRAFTANSLLLDRAEAKIMLGRYEDAAQDLRWYWNCELNTLSADDYKAYITGGYTKFMTNSVFKDYYSDPENVNCFANWDFTQRMSSSYVIPAEATPYMNCLNDFRRTETAFEGYRFFDLKRWGVDLTHVVGVEQEQVQSNYDDDNRAVEVPWETLSAGLESSRQTVTPSKPDASFNLSTLVVKTK